MKFFLRCLLEEDVRLVLNCNLGMRWMPRRPFVRTLGRQLEAPPECDQCGVTVVWCGCDEGHCGSVGREWHAAGRRGGAVRQESRGVEAVAKCDTLEPSLSEPSSFLPWGHSPPNREGIAMND